MQSQQHWAALGLQRLQPVWSIMTLLNIVAVPISAMQILSDFGGYAEPQRGRFQRPQFKVSGFSVCPAGFISAVSVGLSSIHDAVGISKKVCNFFIGRLSQAHHGWRSTTATITLWCYEARRCSCCRLRPSVKVPVRQCESTIYCFGRMWQQSSLSRGHCRSDCIMPVQPSWSRF